MPRLGLLVVAAASGAAVVLVTAWGVFNSLGSARALLNLEGVCTLSLLGLSLARGGAAPMKLEARLNPGWMAAVLASVIVLVFWRALFLGFISDDFVSVQYANTLTRQQLLNAFRTPSGGVFFRPLEYLTLRAFAPFSGYSPVRWHVANLLTHFVNSVLVYAVTVRLYERRRVAGAASLLFAVNGTRAESVGWINGRTELITAFFFLSALLLYLRYCETPHVAALAASLFLALCAVLTKESAYIFPLVLLAIAAFRKEPGFHRPAVHLAFWILAAIAFVWRWTILHGMGGYQSVAAAGAAKALLSRLWAILFFPVNWSAPVGVWLALLTGAYVAALLCLARSHPWRAWFPPAFALLMSLPAVSLLLIGADLQNSRVLYLPTLGFCWWTAVSLEAIPHPRTRWFVLGAVLVFHAAVLQRNLAGL